MKAITIILMFFFPYLAHADFFSTGIVNSPEDIKLDPKFYNVSLSFDEDRNDLKLKIKTLYSGGVQEVKSKFPVIKSGPQGMSSEMVEKKIKFGMMPMIACRVSVPTYFIDDVDSISRFEEVEFPTVFSFYGAEHEVYSNNPIFKDNSLTYHESHAPKVTCTKVPNGGFGSMPLMLRTHHSALKKFLLSGQNELISKMKSWEELTIQQKNNMNMPPIGHFINPLPSFNSIHILGDCGTFKRIFEKDNVGLKVDSIVHDCSNDLSFLGDVAAFNNGLTYYYIYPESNNSLRFRKSPINAIKIEEFNDTQTDFTWLLKLKKLGVIEIDNSSMALNINFEDIVNFLKAGNGNLYEKKLPDGRLETIENKLSFVLNNSSLTGEAIDKEAIQHTIGINSLRGSVMQSNEKMSHINIIYNHQFSLVIVDDREKALLCDGELGAGSEFDRFRQSLNKIRNNKVDPKQWSELSASEVTQACESIKKQIKGIK